MRMRLPTVGLAVTLLATTAVVTPVSAADGDHIYWADYNGRIGRANADGTGVDADFITAPLGPLGVAVDAGHIYWTDFTAGTIGRADLDGSDVDTDWIPSAGSSPYGLAVDAHHVYWGTGNDLARADIDGSDADLDWIPGAGYVTAIDIRGGHIYWSNFYNDHLGRADLDGSNVDASWMAAGSPNGVAVTADHVYWSGYGNGTLGRADIDGSDADGLWQSGVDNATTGMEVYGSRLYFATTGGAIGRVGLDGSGLDDSWLSPGGGYYDVAFDVDAAGDPAVSDGPDVALREGRPLQLDGRSPGRISWSGEDADRYDLRVRIRDSQGTLGPWIPVVNSTTSTSRDRTIYADSSYSYSVRARAGSDKSPWVTGDEFRLRVIDAPSSAFTSAGTWTTKARTDAFGGSVARTTQPDAQLTTRRKGSSLAVVMPTGSAYGTVKTCVDPGTPHQECRIIDLGALSSQPRRMVAVFDRLDPDATHTLRVRAVSGTVELDAVVTLR